jgi:hypothetical protein
MTYIVDKTTGEILWAMRSFNLYPIDGCILRLTQVCKPALEDLEIVETDYDEMKITCRINGADYVNLERNREARFNYKKMTGQW